ncbi:hypothetical protein Bbelb_172320 [Branchiostoma belcheri]|nr:hypothetical protein Bbelb_172320 [Branchiostoma belcheri]
MFVYINCLRSQHSLILSGTTQKGSQEEAWRVVKGPREHVLDSSQLDLIRPDLAGRERVGPRGLKVRVGGRESNGFQNPLVPHSGCSPSVSRSSESGQMFAHSPASGPVLTEKSGLTLVNSDRCSLTAKLVNSKFCPELVQEQAHLVQGGGWSWKAGRLQARIICRITPAGLPKLSAHLWSERHVLGFQPSSSLEKGAKERVEAGPGNKAAHDSLDDLSTAAASFDCRVLLPPGRLLKLEAADSGVRREVSGNSDPSPSLRRIAWSRQAPEGCVLTTGSA